MDNEAKAVPVRASRVTRMVIWIVVGLLAWVAVGIFAADLVNPFNDKRFDPRQWRLNDDRIGMAQDLRDHYLPIGTTKAQIESLLGKAPDGNCRETVERDGSVTLNYYMGTSIIHTMTTGWDEAILVLYFDSEDRLTRAKLTGT